MDDSQDNQQAALIHTLERIAAALERAVPLPAPEGDFVFDSNVYQWDAAHGRLERTPSLPSALSLPLLTAVDRQTQALLENTRQFAEGFSANNALLWGARGMGKSTLIHAVHASVSKDSPRSLILIEIPREDLSGLSALLRFLARYPEHRFILLCDDLSFDEKDDSYKSLKSVLEGSVFKKPGNILFYATSNRRHLIPRQMIENEQRTAINPGEGTDEKVSLADRFGLWLGFYPCTQEEYLRMIDGYVRHFGLARAGEAPEDIHAEALEWAATRGGRSGRVAWQFICDLAGRRRIHIG